MPSAGRRADSLINELAGAQHGAVSRTQLLHAGVRPRVIAWRVRARLLEPVHRGVYRVGPLAGPLTREMAAVLACGGVDAALVSHYSAARMWRRDPPPGPAAPVDVSVCHLDRGRRPGIRPHRVRSLNRDEVTLFEGVPVTTPARTLLDLGALLGARELERLAAAFEREELIRAGELAALVARHPRHPGVREVRRMLLPDGAPAFTRSEAEARLLDLIRRGRLPPPLTNARVHGYEVDFLWRQQRLIVEVDGVAYHSSRRAIERDRERDLVLQADGWRVVRVTWRQIDAQPEATLIGIDRALSAGTGAARRA